MYLLKTFGLQRIYNQLINEVQQIHWTSSAAQMVIISKTESLQVISLNIKIFESSRCHEFLAGKIAMPAASVLSLLASDGFTVFTYDGHGGLKAEYQICFLYFSYLFTTAILLFKMTNSSTPLILLYVLPLVTLLYLQTALISKVKRGL